MLQAQIDFEHSAPDQPSERRRVKVQSARCPETRTNTCDFKQTPGWGQCLGEAGSSQPWPGQSNSLVNSPDFEQRYKNIVFDTGLSHAGSDIHSAYGPRGFREITPIDRRQTRIVAYLKILTTRHAADTQPSIETIAWSIATENVGTTRSTLP